MRSPARRLLGLGGGLGLAYASVLGLMLWQRHVLIYPFDPRPAEPRVERIQAVELPGTGEAPHLPVWLAEPEGARPWVVFFMGNAGSLALHEARLAEIAGAGYGLAAMAYRGGAGAAGDPSEAALKADALRLWQGLDRLAGHPVPERERAIWGLSLGSALAVWLAARVDERAVVLESPFTRLCDAAEFHYPWAPACLLLPDERYDSLALIGRIDSPLLILHGGADRIVPIEQGRALFAAAEEPKTFREYPTAGHNDLGRHGAAADALAFVAALEP